MVSVRETWTCNVAFSLHISVCVGGVWIIYTSVHICEVWCDWPSSPYPPLLLLGFTTSLVAPVPTSSRLHPLKSGGIFIISLHFSAGITSLIWRDERVGTLVLCRCPNLTPDNGGVMFAWEFIGSDAARAVLVTNQRTLKIPPPPPTYEILIATCENHLSLNNLFWWSNCQAVKTYTWPACPVDINPPWCCWL